MNSRLENRLKDLCDLFDLWAMTEEYFCGEECSADKSKLQAKIDSHIIAKAQEIVEIYRENNN